MYHPREAIHVGDTYIEPDMMYLSEELETRMGNPRTSADIVFEVLSRGTANYDRTTKADTYLGLGVLELWLLDAEARSIEVPNATAIKGFPAWEGKRYVAEQSAISRVLSG